MRSFLIGIDMRYRVALEEAAKTQTPNSSHEVPEPLGQLGVFLYALLLGHTCGIPFESVASTFEENGFEAW